MIIGHCYNFAMCINDKNNINDNNKTIQWSYNIHIHLLSHDTAQCFIVASYFPCILL